MMIDIIALVILLLAIFTGFRKGLIIAVFSFLAFFVGLAAALKLSTVAAAYLGRNVNISERWLPVLAFFAVFVIVVLLVRLGARLLNRTTRRVALTEIGRAYLDRARRIVEEVAEADASVTSLQVEPSPRARGCACSARSG